ncbi:MAG TPA: MOSC domain-containing protein [Syntrophales bacterium]|nr:MOSC domain-containing protein [Syntrophales bacterium]HRT70696.1 MOSC domain-containing protein [Syntrophales bacterium]
MGQKTSKGKVLSVNVSDRKGEKKHGVDRCMLVEGFGLTGDAHGGFQHRQVSLLARESIDKIKAHGIDVNFGDFAENLTTEGVELFTLPIGTKIRVGGHVLLRVTQIGKTCHDRCAIFRQVGDCVMPREGIFAEVLTGGEVLVGDTIDVLI